MHNVYENTVVGEGCVCSSARRLCTHMLLLSHPRLHNHARPTEEHHWILTPRTCAAAVPPIITSMKRAPPASPVPIAAIVATSAAMARCWGVRDAQSSSPVPPGRRWECSEAAHGGCVGVVPSQPANDAPLPNQNDTVLVSPRFRTLVVATCGPSPAVDIMATLSAATSLPRRDFNSNPWEVSKRPETPFCSAWREKNSKSLLQINVCVCEELCKLSLGQSRACSVSELRSDLSSACSRPSCFNGSLHQLFTFGHEKLEDSDVCS